MGQGSNSTLEEMLAQYTAQPSRSTNALANTASTQAGRLASAGTPSFEQMFQSYLDVSRREAERNAASINESLGARGNRYGSEILSAQSDLRQRQSQDQALFANQTLLDLEKSRQGLLGLVLQGQQGAAGLETAGRESGMARMFADFLRRTGPPPLLGAATGAGGAPNQVVY